MRSIDEKPNLRRQTVILDKETEYDGEGLVRFVDKVEPGPFNQEKAEFILHGILTIEIQKALDMLIKERIPLHCVRDALLNALAKMMIGVNGLGDISTTVNQCIRYLKMNGKKLSDPRIKGISAEELITEAMLS